MFNLVDGRSKKDLGKAYILRGFFLVAHTEGFQDPVVISLSRTATQTTLLRHLNGGGFGAQAVKPARRSFIHSSILPFLDGWRLIVRLRRQIDSPV